MERSFARGKRYGYDRARWRGLWKMRIQEYMTCAVQNIQVLISRENSPIKDPAMAAFALKASFTKASVFFSEGLRQIRNTRVRQLVACSV